MKIQELCKEIIKYCEEHKMKGGFNKRCGKKLVSFEIKDKQIYCKECGGKLE